MTEPAPALEKLPNWPRWLNACEAAAYLGISTGTFKKERNEDLWPAPGRSSGRWKLWDRLLLDAYSNRVSGLSTRTGDEEPRYDRRNNYFQDRLKDNGNGGDTISGDAPRPR